MEKYLYLKIRRNWQFVHPINKAFTLLDYYLEKLMWKIGRSDYLRKIKVQIGVKPKNRHWYE